MQKVSMHMIRHFMSLQIVVDKFACFIKPQLLSAYTKVLRIPACLNQPHDNLLIMFKPLQ